MYHYFIINITIIIVSKLNQYFNIHRYCNILLSTHYNILDINIDLCHIIYFFKE